MNRSLQWLGKHELVVLVGLLVIVGGTWGFIELADEVIEGTTQGFDEAVVRGLRKAGDPAAPIGPAWMTEVARDLTALGGLSVLLVVTLLLIAGCDKKSDQESRDPA